MRRCVVFLGVSWLVIFFGTACNSAAVDARATPALSQPTATRDVQNIAPAQTLTPTVAPSVTPTRLVETIKIKIKLDTYEASETIGAELSRAKGIVGIVVSESEIVVTFDPQLTNRAEIVQLINKNPEVHTVEP